MESDTPTVGTSRTDAAITLKCPDCGATHVRPRRIDPDAPPETIEGTCYAPHPMRSADFEGCGEEFELKVIEVEE